MFFIIVSVLGILLGIFMFIRGLGGDGLSALAVLAIGAFITFKEVLDIFH